MNRPWVTCLLTTGFALAGCSSAENDWNKANAANTAAAYQQFLSAHPAGQHAVDAADRIHALQDEEAWSLAKQTNSVAAYSDYLQKQPAGIHVKEAQDAVRAVGRAADWQSAQSTGTVAAIQDFLKKYPDGAEAAQARARLDALTGFKIQLAAAKTRREAEKQRARLQQKFGGLLHDVLMVPAGSGKSYGLESGPMSQSEADTACGKLSKARQHCEVVKSEVGKS